MNRASLLGSSKRLVLGMVSAAMVAVPLAPLQASEVEEVGIPAVLPGPGPFFFKSAEQTNMRADIVAKGLSHLYSIDFLPNGDALLVERGVRLRLLRNGTGAEPELTAVPITGIPSYEGIDNLHPDDVLGLQDVELDPDFANNRYVYFAYNRPEGVDAETQRIKASAVLARGKLKGNCLEDITELLAGEAVVGAGGARILPKPDGMIFFSVGALSTGDIESAQRTDNIYGKVLRIMSDGSVPADNPLIGIAGAKPEIWTFGHRDPLGLDSDPKSGRLVASEHGPQGGDELNELVAGGNYGWPHSTYGTEYGGSGLPTHPVADGTRAPQLIWSPSIAPNGITFYDGDVMPGWKRNLFIASARRGQINGTGALIRLVLNDNLQEVRQEVLLDGLHQRFKDVTQGPDGLLYAVTDEADSIVLRIGPDTR